MGWLRNRIRERYTSDPKRYTPISLIFNLYPRYDKEHITCNKLVRLLIDNDSYLSVPLPGDNYDPLMANLYIMHPEIAEGNGAYHSIPGMPLITVSRKGLLPTLSRRHSAFGKRAAGSTRPRREC